MTDPDRVCRNCGALCYGFRCRGCFVKGKFGRLSSGSTSASWSGSKGGRKAFLCVDCGKRCYGIRCFDCYQNLRKRRGLGV